MSGINEIILSFVEVLLTRKNPEINVNPLIEKYCNTYIKSTRKALTELLGIRLPYPIT